MDTDAQARAYANADFAEAHQAYVALFAETFPQRPAQATVLDLGCGPCDVTIRFAKANPGYTFHAVDGSVAMLRYAQAALKRDADLAARIRLVEGFIPGASIPAAGYDVILSSSFLHHLHDPQTLWQTIRQHTKTGTLVFVTDLFRPGSRADAEAFIEKYAGSEPEVLRRDFLNSLLAAFTVEEIKAQLTTAKLDFLQVRPIDDRHQLVFGKVN